MHQKINYYLAKFFLSEEPLLFYLVKKYQTGARYLVAGGAASAVALGILYVLTDIVGVWYLISTVFGQAAGFFTNFFLQKFWTFQDPSAHRTSRQFKLFVGITVLHIILNASFMIILVEVFNLWYMLAQFMALTALAFGSFTFHRMVTFKDSWKIYEDS